MFPVIEVRRLRLYDVRRDWVSAVRESPFANALNPAAGTERRDWREQLSRGYRNPDKKTPFVTAVAHRLQRVSLPPLVGLLFVWLFRLSGENKPSLRAATVPNAPGWLVFAVVLGGRLPRRDALWPDAAVIAAPHLAALAGRGARRRARASPPARRSQRRFRRSRPLSPRSRRTDPRA